MITICPSCSLALAVTAADLRAGQGFVRCSRCLGMFSALPTLREPHEPEPAPMLSPTVSPAVLSPFDPTATDVPVADSEYEFDASRTDVARVFIEPPHNPSAAEPAQDEPGDIVVVDEPSDVTVVEVLSDAGPDASGVTSVEITGDADTATGTEPAAEGPAETPAEGAEPAPPVVETEAAEPAPLPGAPEPPPTTEPDSFVFGPPEPEPPAWHRPALAGAAVILALLLVIQLLNHYRHDLATNPRLYGPLKSLYDAVGLPLVPRWNVRAYDVRQLGAVAGTGNEARLAVRASILNGAKVPQPAPLLRVDVQDRYGNTIATRDVPPALYLPANLRTLSLMAAGQRIDTEVTFLDPGKAAVGFVIDACLPTAEGSLECASRAR